jgi:IS1 family transposase
MQTGSIPKEKHYIGKDQTFTIEGYNASFRDDLRRLTRKTRAYYSKSQIMLESSLICYIFKHNSLKLKLLHSMLGV